MQSAFLFLIEKSTHGDCRGTDLDEVVLAQK